MIRNEPPKLANGDNKLTYELYQEFVDDYRANRLDTSYDTLISGKRIALVGPSPSLEDSDSGGLIDSYDLVVRVNRGYPVSPKISSDIGNRTDIHYHCFHESPKCGGKIYYKEMLQDDVFVCCPYPRKVNPFHRDVERFDRRKGDLKSHYIDDDLYMNCAKLITTRPNSGIGAILDILAHNPEELFVTGFTFFQDGWRKSYKDGAIMEAGWKRKQFSGTHFQRPQMSVINNIIAKDPRLQIDDAMLRVLFYDYIHSD